MPVLELMRREGGKNATDPSMMDEGKKNQEGRGKGGEIKKEKGKMKNEQRKTINFHSRIEIRSLSVNTSRLDLVDTRRY